jgi:hypothetical protein
MTEPDVAAWRDRVWTIGMAVKLDEDHRCLASELVESVVSDPEQAAYLIAALVQMSNS